MSKFSHEGRLRRAMMLKEANTPVMVFTSPAASTPDASKALERYEHTDVAKNLGFDTVPEMETISRARPDRHSSPMSMPSGLVRFPGRAALGLTTPLVPATFMAGATLMLTATKVGPYSTLPIVLGAIAFVLTYVAMVCMSIDSLFNQYDAKVLDTYASTAPRRLGRMMCDRPLDEIADATARMTAIAGDRRPEAADLRRYALTRFMRIDEAYRDALKTIGTSSPARFRDQASTAALKILADVGEQIAVVDAQIAQRDEIAARGIGDAFSDSMARIASGTPAGPREPATFVAADARINRLVDAARRALEVDPDMVDDAGARVDALVRTHLPSLVERHAEASRHARLEDLDALDRDLANGIEMVRRSIDEGLAHVRSESADRLRTEVAFLRARRLEDTLDLTARAD